MVEWGNKCVKSHGPWGKARRGYHEFGRWEMTIMEQERRQENMVNGA